MLTRAQLKVYAIKTLALMLAPRPLAGGQRYSNHNLQNPRLVEVIFDWVQAGPFNVGEDARHNVAQLPHYRPIFC